MDTLEATCEQTESQSDETFMVYFAPISKAFSPQQGW